MSLLEAAIATSIDFAAVAPTAAPAPLSGENLSSEAVLALARRHWTRLVAQPGVGPRPTLSALVYALSRMVGLGPDERRQLEILRGRLPRALLALDLPEADLAELGGQDDADAMACVHALRGLIDQRSAATEADGA